MYVFQRAFCRKFLLHSCVTETFVVIIVIFLLKFQTSVTLCSGELWSNLIVRPAHSADLRSRLRHVSSAPSVACSTGCFRVPALSEKTLSPLPNAICHLRVKEHMQLSYCGLKREKFRCWWQNKECSCSYFNGYVGEKAFKVYSEYASLSTQSLSFLGMHFPFLLCSLGFITNHQLFITRGKFCFVIRLLLDCQLLKQSHGRLEEHFLS